MDSHTLMLQRRVLVRTKVRMVARVKAAIISNKVKALFI